MKGKKSSQDAPAAISAAVKEAHPPGNDVALTLGSTSTSRSIVSITDIPIPVFESHEARADFIIEHLRFLTRLVDRYAVAAPGRRREIASAASLSDDALEAVALGCDASPNLATASMLTAPEVRDALSSSVAGRRVLRELLTIARGMADTIAETRAGVGSRCRRALYILHQMTLKDDRQAAVAHLPEMEEAFKRPRKSKLEREVNVALKDAKRAAGGLSVSLTAQPRTFEFKAGRDL
ncbi:MAG TPA: hypothetical protein VEK57_00925 [Thermoanaerobaculia bacterium]|nr:hypothetical protein [Thermoanaerobaculia bacterium]